MERRCAQCGKPIVFIPEAGREGRYLAVDSVPVRYVPGGGPRTFVTPEGKITYGKLYTFGRMMGYLPHWKTCPHRDWIRKELKDKW